MTFTLIRGVIYGNYRSTFYVHLHLILFLTLIPATSIHYYFEQSKFGKEESKMIFRSDRSSLNAVFKLPIQNFSLFPATREAWIFKPKILPQNPPLPFTICSFPQKHFGLTTGTNHWTLPFKCPTKIVSDHYPDLRKKEKKSWIRYKPCHSPSPPAPPPLHSSILSLTMPL